MLTLKEKRDIVYSFLEEFEASHICDWGEFMHDGVSYYLSEHEEMPIIDDGKYSYGEIIYKIGAIETDDEFYVSQTFTRTGSWYSDYETEYDLFEIVEPREVTKIEWEAVRED